jgi:hypothetical protein
MSVFPLLVKPHPATAAVTVHKEKTLQDASLPLSLYTQAMRGF